MAIDGNGLTDSQVSLVCAFPSDVGLVSHPSGSIQGFSKVSHRSLLKHMASGIWTHPERLTFPPLYGKHEHFCIMALFDIPRLAQSVPPTPPNQQLSVLIGSNHRLHDSAQGARIAITRALSPLTSIAVAPSQHSHILAP